VEVDNATTIDLAGLETVGGSATFLRGNLLSSLSLPALDSVGSLTVEAMPILSAVSLSGLTEPSGNLQVVECDGLVTMDGFASLTGVQGSLVLTGNDVLTDVDGLSGITSVGGDLLIQDNVSLATADAEALVYEDIGETNVGGGVAIVGNAP